MNAQDLINLTIAFLSDFDFIVKIILIILLLPYLLFALILAQQIFSLGKSYNQINFSPIIKTLSILHVLAVIAVLLYVILVL